MRKDDTYSFNPDITNYFYCDTAQLVNGSIPPASTDTSPDPPVIISTNRFILFQAGGEYLVDIYTEDTIEYIMLSAYSLKFDGGSTKRYNANSHYKYAIPTENHANKHFSIPIRIDSAQTSNFSITVSIQAKGLNSRQFSIPITTAPTLISKLIIKLEWTQPADLDLWLNEKSSNQTISVLSPLSINGGRLTQKMNENCLINDTATFSEIIVYDSTSIISPDQSKYYEVFVDKYSNCEVDTDIEYKVYAIFENDTITTTGSFQYNRDYAAPLSVGAFTPANLALGFYTPISKNVLKIERQRK